MCSYRAVLEQRSDELIKRRTCKEKTPQFFNTTACFECLSRESLSWQMIKAPVFSKQSIFSNESIARENGFFFFFEKSFFFRTDHAGVREDFEGGCDVSLRLFLTLRAAVVSCEKRIISFPMFVPSLSWQNDHV
jgi:hypothetical protein